MQIRDIMYTGEKNAVVSVAGCFRDVLEELNRKKLGAVCIVDGEKLIGLVTDGDIRRLLLSTQKPLPHLFVAPAASIAILNPKTIGPNASLEEGLALLEQNQFWVLPVTDDSMRLLGLLHLHRLLKSLVR